MSTLVETRLDGGTSLNLMSVLDQCIRPSGVLNDSADYVCNGFCDQTQHEWVDVCSRTSRASGIKEPPAHRRDNNVDSYPAT
jgi:hypothetical protein